MSKRINVLYCDNILHEYRSVINRDKFAKFIKVRQAFRLIGFVIPQLEKINLISFIELSRDPKDNYLLSLAIDGEADYLITGDLDLLVLKQIGKTQIIKLNTFLDIFPL